MPEPAAEDLFEIKIPGFSQQLSFTLDACTDYLELANIGPTDMQNDISITSIASRDDSQLTVWCYPFHKTGDAITGIGDASPSIWEKETYIETESGFTSTYQASGQRIAERFMFDLPEEEHSVTLHIPYLTMVRDENVKITIPVPIDYSAQKSDLSVDFSLGTVRITELERKPSQYPENPDVLRISFAFDSLDSNKVFNSSFLSMAKASVKWPAMMRKQAVYNILNWMLEKKPNYRLPSLNCAIISWVSM